MIRIRTLTLVSVIAALPACCLNKKILELEHSRLEMELSSLNFLKTNLSDPAFPPGKRHVSFFVSYGVLNAVLAGADNLDVPIPSIKGANLHITQLRIKPLDGTPLLAVAAFATRGSLRVDVEVLAEMLLDTADPIAPMFRVRVLKIAPAVSWKWFQLSNWSFANKLATVKGDSLAIDKLAFPLPLEHAVRVDVPAMSVVGTKVTERGNGSTVRYRITRPEFNLSGSVRVTAFIFLRDGIHVVADLV